MPTTAVAERPVAPAPGIRSTRWLALPEMRWAAAALSLFLLGLLTQATQASQATGTPPALTEALYLGCYAAGGWEPALAGLRALREKTLDVDLLMVVAAIGAAAIGQVLDGALLIVIFATSGALEAFATARTEDSVRGLLELAPETATRMTAHGEHTVPVTDLTVEDEVIVRPGERIGADGQVVSGRSDVDQATITGEPLPAGKQPGDEVFAGTLNGTGTLRVRVTRPAHDSVVARIAGLVHEAGATRATTQLFVEKVEQRYSIGMVAATLLLLTVPLLLGENPKDALLRAMTFMIVASPCAIVLSIMPPLLAAVANAGRHGVLIKSALVMERLATTTQIAFDKTGTLTHGTPVLAGIHPFGSWSTGEVLRLAAAVEHGSEHPLARAVVREAREKMMDVPPAHDFEAHPGVGVAGTVEGHHIVISSPRGHQLPLVAERQDLGETVVLVHIDGDLAAVAGFTDRLRPDARRTIAAASTLTTRPPLLLTGDNPAAAAHVARRAGLPEVRAGLLPHEKLDAVRHLQAEGEHLTFIGDGINDAPALAAAHVGIAMGGVGADLSLDTADAVVVRNDLTSVPAVIALSRKARQVMIANLTIAATFIAVLVLWDLLGDLPLPLGVAGHEGSTVVVGLNGLRLLSEKHWKN